MMNFPTSDVLCPESCNHLVLMPAANKQQGTVNKATRRIHHPPLSLSSCLACNSADTLDIVCSSPQRGLQSAKYTCVMPALQSSVQARIMF